MSSPSPITITNPISSSALLCLYTKQVSAQ
jgi:hypothetical protein